MKGLLQKDAPRSNCYLKQGQLTTPCQGARATHVYLRGRVNACLDGRPGTGDPTAPGLKAHAEACINEQLSKNRGRTRMLLCMPLRPKTSPSQAHSSLHCHTSKQSNAASAEQVSKWRAVPPATMCPDACSRGHSLALTHLPGRDSLCLCLAQHNYLATVSEPESSAEDGSKNARGSKAQAVSTFQHCHLGLYTKG